MKRIVILSLLVAMVLGTSVALAVNDEVLGNGAPQSKLLGKLNIVGVKKGKNANMDNDGGSTIFVALGKDGEPERTKIMLTQGDDFAVLDKNGTDGEAEFQLPDPNLDPYVVGNKGNADTLSAYSVFIRPLGKPGGYAEITTCADLVDSGFGGLLPGQLQSILNRQEGSAYCSIEQVAGDITLRTNGKDGKTVFTNVTAELLTIVFKVVVDTDPTEGVTLETVCIRVPIFDEIIKNEYWEYDDEGLKLLQVRFYEYETDVSAGDGDLDC